MTAANIKLPIFTTKAAKFYKIAPYKTERKKCNPCRELQCKTDDTFTSKLCKKYLDI